MCHARVPWGHFDSAAGVAAIASHFKRQHLKVGHLRYVPSVNKYTDSAVHFRLNLSCRTVQAEPTAWMESCDNVSHVLTISDNLLIPRVHYISDLSRTTRKYAASNWVKLSPALNYRHTMTRFEKSGQYLELHCYFGSVLCNKSM